MVSVRHLNKSFGGVNAVTDLSFQIKPGEIVGFLGPNGAGKTTTMRLLTGYLVPDSGEIEIDGKPLLDNPVEQLKKVGYLPENNPLYKDMLVSDLLNYSADLKNLSDSQKRSGLDFAVHGTGLSNVFYRPISELSKGYRQRVGIALALLHKPKILIMDEPSEGLDPNQRGEMRSLIRSLARDHTIIVSTHVMAEAEAISNRLMIINRGKLIADGSPSEIMRKAVKTNDVHFEIEGKDVESKVRNIKGVIEVTVKKIKSGRAIGIIHVREHDQVQPEISKLSHKNKWIIWKLAAVETPLEDIFQILTK